MTAEEWRPIPSAPGYEASSAGRIRNATTGAVLSPNVTSRGYLRLFLGRRRRDYVHRLVCEAFHGAPPVATYHADHVDWDRTNNTPGNLRWLPPEDNRHRHFRQHAGLWVVEEDEAPTAPTDYAPPTDAEAAALDEALKASGW